MKKMRLPRKTKKELKRISIRYMAGDGCVTQIIRVTGKMNERTMKLVRRIIYEQRMMLKICTKHEIVNSIKECLNDQNSQYGNSIFL